MRLFVGVSMSNVLYAFREHTLRSVWFQLVECCRETVAYAQVVCENCSLSKCSLCWQLDTDNGTIVVLSTGQVKRGALNDSALWRLSADSKNTQLLMIYVPGNVADNKWEKLRDKNTLLSRNQVLCHTDYVSTLCITWPHSVSVLIKTNLECNIFTDFPTIFSWIRNDVKQNIRSRFVCVGELKFSNLRQQPG